MQYAQGLNYHNKHNKSLHGYRYYLRTDISHGECAISKSWVTDEIRCRCDVTSIIVTIGIFLSRYLT